MGNEALRRIKGYKIVKILILTLTTLLIVIASMITYDHLIMYFHKPWFTGIDCKVLVVDVNNITGEINVRDGIVIVKGMTVNDFRVLGACRCRVIVIVAHGLTITSQHPLGLLSRGDYAIETSETDVTYAPIVHPLMALTGSIVKGEIPGLGERVAVTKNIIKYSIGFKGKTIVLLTCSAPGIEGFARALMDAGAEHVIYPTRPIDLDEALTIITEITKAEDINTIIDILGRYDFIVIG